MAPARGTRPLALAGGYVSGVWGQRDWRREGPPCEPYPHALPVAMWAPRLELPSTGPACLHPALPCQLPTLLRPHLYRRLCCTTYEPMRRRCVCTRVCVRGRVADPLQPSAMPHARPMPSAAAATPAHTASAPPPPRPAHGPLRASLNTLWRMAHRNGPPAAACDGDVIAPAVPCGPPPPCPSALDDES